MGLNVSKGLENLGKGLGALTDHAIYKDERAREDRFRAAQAAFQERQMSLQEKMFASSEQRHKEEFGHRKEVDKAELGLRERGLEVQETTAAATIEHQQQSLQLQKDTLAERKEAARQQAQTDEERARLATYDKTIDRNMERSFDLMDQRAEIESSMTMSPEAKANSIKHIEDQLATIKSENFRTAYSTGMIKDEDFTDEQNAVLGWIQETQPNMDKGAAIAFMMDMPVSEIVEVAQSLGMQDDQLQQGLGLGDVPPGTQNETAGGGGPGPEGPPAQGGENDPSVGGFLKDTALRGSQAAGREFRELANHPLGATGGVLQSYGEFVAGQSAAVSNVVMEIWKMTYGNLAKGTAAAADEFMTGFGGE